ncbi:MAG: gamma carbonic anhydrase family protein [Deltaproteobacteria bacterium]|mgnify:CR=1 FL=1|jgi:carbonic anhydrase/acetyltransferase-like protein (isoleucine patch superfamily)|nr:MAG: gamma carbonic anhydrase family protein [Deltaproteobacteria bacterium]
MIRAYCGISPRIDATAFVADSAEVIGDVTVGKESSIWFQSVVRGDVNYIQIGSRTNIQDCCVLHVRKDTYPLVIGDEVTVGHRVVLHGCTVRSRVLIGIGAIVLDGAVVEENSIVGAGTLVPPGFRVPSGTVVMGIPAKVKRDLRADEIQLIEQSAKNYVEYLKKYI